jgi:tripartite-type tricarboxylate transporter receptor subunit TctC
MLLSASIGPITFGPLVNRTPYDVERELAPVISFGVAPYMLLVKPDFAATDARSFVALLKANPGQYTFPSSGIGGAQHLLTAVFNAKAGIDALHVPFQGSGPALSALLAGQVDYAIDTPAERAAARRAATGRGGGCAGLRYRRLERADGAGGNAAADHRPAVRGGEGRPRHCRAA